MKKIGNIATFVVLASLALAPAKKKKHKNQ